MAAGPSATEKISHKTWRAISASIWRETCLMVKSMMATPAGVYRNTPSLMIFPQTTVWLQSKNYSVVVAVSVVAVALVSSLVSAVSAALTSVLAAAG